MPRDLPGRPLRSGALDGRKNCVGGPPTQILRLPIT